MLRDNAVGNGLARNRVAKQYLSTNHHRSGHDTETRKEANSVSTHGTEADAFDRLRQVNRTVHTIVLRACGLSREEVSAIQANAAPQTKGPEIRGRQGGRDGGEPSSEGGGGVGDTRADGVASKRDPSKDPLPWREEKRLGFRAACLRDWLVDAAR